MHVKEVSVNYRIAGTITGVFLGLAFWLAVGYVAVHFILKFW